MYLTGLDQRQFLCTYNIIFLIFTNNIIKRLRVKHQIKVK